MATYTVEWTIEISASTPDDAAREAQKSMRFGAIATVFDVYSEEGDGSHCWTQVDLGQHENICEVTT